MGLDIKELHIGSSVLYEGERVEVWGIEQEQGFYDIIVHNKARKYEDNMFHSSREPYLIRSGVDKISPIPITEELLKELGFEKSETNQYDWYKHIDDFSIFIKIFKRGRCRAEVYSEFSHHGNMVCYYLHELETFVYLTTKKELI